ncbi:MAG: hypothetical protein ACD_75C00302G0017 [uncultured bacterium]|nr:MAG: hypothetical protein ACD_75C00302G0017 [uncultured bacterium]
MGITAFELITGKIPFTPHEIMEIFQNNGQRVLPDPLLFVPEIFPELRWFIIKACQHEREERYQDILDALGELAPLPTTQHLAAIPSPEEQPNSATITFRYTDKQREDFNRLMREFSRRSRELDIDFDVFKNQDQ